MRPGAAVAAAILALVAGAAAAADHPVEGDTLRLRDPGVAARRVGKFRAARDLAIDPADIPDPRVVGATVEISGTGVGDGTSGSIDLPAGLWKGLGNPPGSKGYKYLDRDITTGIRRVVFRSGTKGGKIVVIGRRENWPYEVIQPQGAVTFRLQIGDEVYCSNFFNFRRNEVKSNGVGLVVARHAAAPASCAPIVCGNGVVDGAEECDDGNTDDGDGCSGSCELEDISALCAGVPTATGTALTSALFASGLSSPVGVAAPRLDPSRVFIVEKPGRIRIVKNGTLLPSPFLSITAKVSGGSEQGLLGLAFHPDYESNGRFFVDYTDTSGDTVIARYQVSADPDDADEASEIVLRTIPQPYTNHNGGQIAFGPDGYLYVGMGDGGSGGDPLENGQSDTTLLGKLLRIDVDVDSPPYYAVPASNPNAGAGDPLGIIWAKGLRNPWRFSFDRLTGDVLIADVGQGQWEEVDLQPAASGGGENYGWDIFEGNHCYDPQPDYAVCPDPVAAGLSTPIHEYDHGLGCSITGGFVYRGCRMPDLHGTYFYADWCSAFIKTFTISGGAAQNHADRTVDLAPGVGLSINSPTSFGEDARGELYIADQTGGEVFKILPGS